MSYKHLSLEERYYIEIEMMPEQHQRLKAIADLSGKSIKDYVLERVFSESSALNEKKHCVN